MTSGVPHHVSKVTEFVHGYLTAGGTQRRRLVTEILKEQEGTWMRITWHQKQEETDNSKNRKDAWNTVEKAPKMGYCRGGTQDGIL